MIIRGRLSLKRSKGARVSSTQSLSSFDFNLFAESEIAPHETEIASDPAVLTQVLHSLLEKHGLEAGGGLNIPDNSTLEKVFGSSISLAFTLWQHLAAVERLVECVEWQSCNAETWKQIASGQRCCGLATTHLANSDRALVQGGNKNGGFLVNGVVPWVTGYGIFESLLLGFECDDEIVFAEVPFPCSAQQADETGINIESLNLVCLSGTSTVRLSFKDTFVPRRGIVSRRKKSEPVEPRVSRYILPEIGIARGVIAEIEEIVAESTSPRHRIVRDSLGGLISRLDHFVQMRNDQAPMDRLMPLRDELIRDSIRLLCLTLGSKALNAGSKAARLQLEFLLLDSVLQPMRVLENKIQRTCSGVSSLD